MTRDLSVRDRQALVEHFLALGAEDRRLRFGMAVADDALREYVARIDFARDALFGVFNRRLRLVGVAHVAVEHDDAELGISVLPRYRGRGIGGALLERSHLYARNQGIRRLLMHCLAENAAMMRLARRQGMQVVVHGGEAAARVAVPPADAASRIGELVAIQVGLFDFALKALVRAARGGG
ncbi:MAG TPA: GNAT family N-acetyltransferase [Burkholderiaceae bacterium]|nr:GNAT family N-acetyltransferase [Burkholderiaceae bacterium]